MRASIALTKIRQAVFLIHMMTGCVAGLVIFFLAATGFLLAWEKPVIAWQESGYRTSPPPAGDHALPLDQLTSLAARTAGEKPSAVVVHSDDTGPVEVEFGRGRRLLLNPWSGAVLGVGAVRTRAFFETVTGLHRWFGASPQHHATARLVKGAFDLSLLFMLITGAYLWLPRVWSWGRTRSGIFLRPNLTGKARNWNLHNVLGFWAALPLAVIVLTGAILAYGWATNLLYWAAGNSAQASADPPKVTEHRTHHKHDQPELTAIALQQVLDSAAADVPGWRSIRITLPQADGKSFSVTADRSDGGRPDQQTELAFDGYSGALRHTSSFDSLSRGRQLRSFAKYVHTGEAGDIAGETLAACASLACCGLVWTGFAMALHRLRLTRSASRRTLLTAKPKPAEAEVVCASVQST